MLAVALPEISEDSKVWTVRIRPGIQFGPDAAFAGKSRELTADDLVYSLKRFLDPSLRRGGARLVTDLIVGARAIVDAAKATGGKFNYEREMPGLRALDRHTLQLHLAKAAGTHRFLLVASEFFFPAIATCFRGFG